MAVADKIVPRFCECRVSSEQVHADEPTDRIEQHLLNTAEVVAQTWELDEIRHLRPALIFPAP